MSRVAVSFNRPLMGIAVASSLGTGYGFGALLHMQAIITLQQSARSELAAPTPNKDGHGARALPFIDQAIAEVNEGINFAAPH
jgi:hypothetical protein